ncbi:response regulator [Aestuariirhabdus sp. Z083]|nr:response regulator [Aestuariirhabdus haliotis]
MSLVIPKGMARRILFAEHGQQALHALERESIDLMFLDLTMPVMDGYQTLEQLRHLGVNCLVIVVSGDIQPAAQARVLDLGALAFIKKPVDSGELEAVLQENGLLDRTYEDESTAIGSAAELIGSSQQTPQECLQEIANVAMGQAADRLARLLGVFIELPIPRLAALSGGELAMTLDALTNGNHIAVCQGFVSRGLAAEALLSMDVSDAESLRKLMHQRNLSLGNDDGAVLDAAIVLISAFLNGMGRILDTSFSKSQPALVSAETLVLPLWRAHKELKDETLVIEVPYKFEEYNVSCDLLLLFPGPAAEAILENASYLIDDEGAKI